MKRYQCTTNDHSEVNKRVPESLVVGEIWENIDENGALECNWCGVDMLLK